MKGVIDVIDRKTARSATGWLDSALSGIAEELAEVAVQSSKTPRDARARLRRLAGLSKDLAVLVGALRRLEKHNASL